MNNQDNGMMSKVSQMVQRLRYLQDQIKLNNSQGNSQANQPLINQYNQLNQQLQQFARLQTQQQQLQRQQQQQQAPPQMSQQQQPQQPQPPISQMPPTPMMNNAQPQPPMNKNINNDQGSNNHMDQDAMRKKLNIQIQTELFIKTLHDFYASQNRNLNVSSITIENRPVNLFLLYFLVNKMGGFNNVCSNNQWSSVAARLNLAPPNVNNPTVPNQLLNYYKEYIFQFDQFLKTPEGQKQLESNKKQKLMEMQQKKNPNSFPAPPPNTNQPSQPINIPQPSPQIAAPQMLPPQSSISSPNIQHPSQSPQAIPPSRSSVQNTPRVQSSSLAETSADAPVIIKKYDPMVRPTNNTHAGLPLKKILTYGESLDPAKPNYLFAPESGTINIHALVMALQSGSLSEVNNVLNMLLVITSDMRINLVLDQCPDIIDSVSSLGLTVLNELIFDNIDASNNNSVYRERVSKEAVKKRSRKIFKNEAFEIDDYDKVSPYDKYYHSSIDDEFIDFIKQHSIEKDVVITVDSFTGEEVDDTEDVEMDYDMDSKSFTVEDLENLTHQTKYITPKTFGNYIDNEARVFRNDDSEKLNGEYKDIDEEKIYENIGKFNLPRYMELLAICNQEFEETFSGIHVRASENYQVMLVDQLATISMILRNLTFLPNNRRIIADNSIFKKFIFRLILSCFGFDEYFIVSRRKLTILKDCLVTFMNVAQLIKLTNFTQALLVVLLSLEFSGPTSKAGELNSKNLLSEYIPPFEKFQSFAIDMFTKFMVNSKENRFLIRCVLTGKYEKPVPPPPKFRGVGAEIDEIEEELNEILSNEFYTSIGFEDEDEQIQKENLVAKYTYKLSKLYIQASYGYSELPESGILLKKMIGYLLSSVPFNSQDIIEIEDSSPLIIQSLLGTNLLLKILPTDKTNLALELALSHEAIVSGLLKLGFLLSAYRSGQNKDHLMIISHRCLEAVNLIFYKLFQRFGDLNNEILSNITEETKEEIKLLLTLPRIFPSFDVILGCMANPGIEPIIIKEVTKLANYCAKIKEFILKSDDYE